MTTGSTASSGTDGPDPQDPREADEAAPPAADDAATPAADVAAAPDADQEQHDPARRAFFFQFGKQAVSAVGQVAGMANVVGRTSSAMANELLGLEEPTEQPTAFVRAGATSEPVVSAAAPAADDAFRSAYRLTADELVLLDQRGIPEKLDEVAARRGSDVAYYLRLGVSRGGPLLAQVAAYGLALTASERTEQPAEQRGLELRRTAKALIEARPSAFLLRWSMARMQGAISDLGEAVTGESVATTLRAEADAIARDIQTWHAAIADNLAAELSGDTEVPLTLLVHGEQGALSGGLIGTGLAALSRLQSSGQELRVFLTEGRPFMDGARLASWELRQAGIEHKVVPDSAVAWLLQREGIDAVLIAADWVAANGDVGALVGSRAVAQLAAAVPEGGARPRVIVSGISAIVDPETADGNAIPVELRTASEQSAYLAADVPIRAADALVPAADVVPVGIIDTFVTERGAAIVRGAG